MQTEQIPPENPAKPASPAPAEPAAAPQPAAASPPPDDQTPPPAAQTVLTGKETEETADLRRKLEAQARELRAAQTKASMFEDENQRLKNPPAPAVVQKRAWLAGNALIE